MVKKQPEQNNSLIGLLMLGKLQTPQVMEPFTVKTPGQCKIIFHRLVGSLVDRFANVYMTALRGFLYLLIPTIIALSFHAGFLSSHPICYRYSTAC